MRALARAGCPNAWLIALAIGALAGAARAELVVGAASSLREPLRAISDRFEARHPGVGVATSFGASSALARQVRAGAPIDVFASADPRIARALAGDGWLDGEPVPIARNRLVAICAPDLAYPLERPADLLRPELRRIALPDEAIPVGHYAREWLRARGLLDALADRSVRTEHALATLRAVDAGLADAAIVYATDARLARRARVAFEIPDEEQPEIVYVAAPLRAASDPDTARAFVRFLRSPEAEAALRAAGFALPRAPGAP